LQVDALRELKLADLASFHESFVSPSSEMRRKLCVRVVSQAHAGAQPSSPLQEQTSLSNAGEDSADKIDKGSSDADNDTSLQSKDGGVGDSKKRATRIESVEQFKSGLELYPAPLLSVKVACDAH
jgi:hypothetical protein